MFGSTWQFQWYGNSRAKRGGEDRGEVKILSTSTRCKDWRLDVGKLAPLQQASESVGGFHRKWKSDQCVL